MVVSIDLQILLRLRLYVMRGHWLLLPPATLLLRLHWIKAFCFVRMCVRACVCVWSQRLLACPIKPCALLPSGLLFVKMPWFPPLNSPAFGQHLFSMQWLAHMYCTVDANKHLSCRSICPAAMCLKPGTAYTSWRCPCTTMRWSIIMCHAGVSVQ